MPVSEKSVVGSMAKLTEYTRYADAQEHAIRRRCGSCSTAIASISTSRTSASTVTRTARAARRCGSRMPTARDEILSFDEIAAGGALRALAGGARHRSRAIASPSCWSRRCPSTWPVRRDDDGRDQRAAVHPVRAATALRLRVDDCTPKLLITNAEKAEIAARSPGCGSSSPTRRCWPRWRAFRAPTRRRRARTTWRCSSTRRAPRASCRRR